MRKRGIVFVILISLSTFLSNVMCQRNNLLKQLFGRSLEPYANHDEIILVKTPLNILRRIVRQTGYNYDKPTVSFELPTRSTGIPVTPKPVPSPQTNPVGNYNYPSPGIDTRSQGYDSSTPKINPFNEAPRKEIGGTSGYPDMKASRGEYSYDIPPNPINMNLPLSSIPVVQPASTIRPDYLPPRSDSFTMSSLPPTSFEQTTKTYDVSIPSSTPGEPYLPPKIGSPVINIQQTQLSTSSPNYIPPVNIPIKSSASNATPKKPVIVRNSYLVPIESSSHGPNILDRSYISPSRDSPSIPTSSSNGPVSSDVFISPASVTPGPQIVSTPAMSYLPPYN